MATAAARVRRCARVSFGLAFFGLPATGFASGVAVAAGASVTTPLFSRSA